MKAIYAILAGTCLLASASDVDAGGQQYAFWNPMTINIPSSGPADLYPSTLQVSTVPLIDSYEITVKLWGLSHTWPGDLDILLTGPGGFSVLLMSDAGGSFDLVNIDLIFEEGAPSLPESSLIAPGVYSPTNYGDGDLFPAPAPGGPYGNLLNAFTGNPNGTWQLWVYDDTGGDPGVIELGWSITFTVPAPSAIAVFALALVRPNRTRRSM